MEPALEAFAFLTTLAAAWSASTGQLLWWPVAVAAGSISAQCHENFASPAFSWWPAPPASAFSPGSRGLAAATGSLAGGCARGLGLWLAPIIEEVTGHPRTSPSSGKPPTAPRASSACGGPSRVSARPRRRSRTGLVVRPAATPRRPSSTPWGASPDRRGGGWQFSYSSLLSWRPSGGVANTLLPGRGDRPLGFLRCRGGRGRLPASAADLPLLGRCPLAAGRCGGVGHPCRRDRHRHRSARQMGPLPASPLATATPGSSDRQRGAGSCVRARPRSRRPTHPRHSAQKEVGAPLPPTTPDTDKLLASLRNSPSTSPSAEDRRWRRWPSSRALPTCSTLTAGSPVSVGSRPGTSAPPLSPAGRCPSGASCCHRAAASHTQSGYHRGRHPLVIPLEDLRGPQRPGEARLATCSASRAAATARSSASSSRNSAASS